MLMRLRDGGMLSATVTRLPQEQLPYGLIAFF